MLSVSVCRNADRHYAECHCAECYNVECRYAECHYAQCHYAECRGTIKTVPCSNVTFIFLLSLLKVMVKAERYSREYSLRLSTVDLLIKTACFVIKDNISILKI